MSAMSSLHITSSYGWADMSPSVFRANMKVVAGKIQKLKKEHKFDVLACTGTSGCAAAFAISMFVNIPVMYVRKKDEDAHTNFYISNYTGHVRRYLIVDDFIDRGNTIEHIVTSINNLTKRLGEGAVLPTCSGIFLYEPIGTDKHFVTRENISIPLFY